MPQVVKLLSHQASFVQAPYVFPEKRFFFLCGGFACGKTSSLVYAVMFAIKQLLGKKDKEGHNPKIMVCSKNITFLAKTWTNAFEQNLTMTNSEYRYDKAKNIMSVGNVEIILVPTEEPTQIYGYSTTMALVDELDELPTDVAMEAVKSINDRVRQQIDGFRSPFIAFATTSQGLKGLYQTVMHFQKSGIGYVLLRARTRDNIYLPKDYIKNIYSIYNEKEVACLLEGQFISIDSGLVFPDYDPAKNKLDMDLFGSEAVSENDTIYIGQDFNCIQGDVLISTLKGDVRMRDLKEGDYVLTRKGFKRVLHKESKGVRMVQDFNKGLVATPDHIAITPQGEIELRKAEQFYCLKEQNTEYLKEERKVMAQLFELKKLLSEEESTEGTQKGVQVALITSGMEKKAYIQQFIKLTLERLEKEIKSTTRMGTMITDLKILKKFLFHSTLLNISKKEVVCLVKKVRGILNSITTHKKESLVIPEFQNLLGKTEHTIVLLFALIVEKNLMQESEQHSDVKNVSINGIFTEKEKITKALSDIVKCVEKPLQEQVQLHIVKNTSVIGKDQSTEESRYEEVFDIAVEDCHEFYANGILVHNCFGNHAVALVVKKFSDGQVCIVVIKDYIFPDIRRAPEVFRYDFPTQKIVWIPDMTYKEHFTEFKKELRLFKITIAYRSCNPLVNDRIFACNKLFHAERLFICPMCKNVEKALLTHQRDPKTGMPMKGGVNAPDHDSDALGMAVHYLLSWNRDLKPLYEVTLQYIYSKRRARGADAKELEIGTQLLTADKLKAMPLLKAPNVEENAFNA